MEKVLLVGNPNSGKTTLFNALAKANEHVGNWHGVTVDTKNKVFDCDGQDYVLVDTPGLYSLDALSFEEKVAVEQIKSENKKIINLCDKNNLQRNFYLTLCLIEQGCDVVVAVNEIDKRAIYKIDCKKLSKELGVQVVELNAEKKVGLTQLKNAVKEKQKSVYLSYMSKLNGEIANDSRVRYDFIDSILSKCTIRSKQVYGKSKIDKFVLNKWLAFPVFMTVLSAIFYLTFFSLGAVLSDALSALLSFMTNPILNVVERSFGQGWVYDLFNIAIFGGLGTVISFLPQVVLLFFFLSVLEDSGYLSRVAFIFEDILGRIGLSGKSVYTLLMGFGCSTTAIMTSRNMEDKNAKIKTAIMCPYMSCSAKIPIYTVIGGAFFGANNIFFIIGLYLLGVIVALVISKILESSVLKSKQQSFILEFPPYRTTSFRRIVKILWSNLKTFLFKVGTIMLAMNVVVWLLSSFSFSFSYVPTSGASSMLETIGKFIAPIFIPLGFGNWPVVSALLAGLVAKEVVVSSIAMFNGIDASSRKLLAQSIMLSSSAVFFSSKASVLSFMVFCLLYTPCIASISMLLQEIGKKWTFISIIIQLLCAYIVSFVVYNIAFAFEVFGFEKPFVTILTLGIISLSIFFIIKKIRRGKGCVYCDNCNNNCGKRKK